MVDTVMNRIPTLVLSVGLLTGCSGKGESDEAMRLGVRSIVSASEAVGWAGSVCTPTRAETVWGPTDRLSFAVCNSMQASI